MTVAKEQVRSAPDLDLHGQEMSQADESALYHHFQMNYTPIPTRVADASPDAEPREVAPQGQTVEPIAVDGRWSMVEVASPVPERGSR